MSVEMKLELGHRATMREKPTAEGFTHDWLVFVKGAEGSDIFFFVDKVVFHLHDSFPKPKRVVKEPPYEVAESGYAGFIIPIEVYFRNKEEPKKVRFEYDLFLSLESSPVNNIRREKLTFQNPSEDFRRKLLKARGIGSGSTVSSGTPSLQTQTSASIQHVDEPPRLAAVHTKSTPVAEKKIKSHSTGKEASHSSHSKPNKVLPPPSGPSGNANNKEPKSVSKASHSPEGKEPKGKSAKSDKEPKSVSKRSAPDGQNHHGPSEKKKRHHSNSDGSDKHADSNKTKETKEKKEKHKNKVSGHSSKKEKHKASAQSNTTNKDHITKSPSKSINSVKSVSPSRLSNEDSNDAKSALMHDDDEDNNSSPASDFGDAAETWCEISPDKMDISSGKDSISPMSPDIEQSPPPVVEKLRRNSNHDTEENEKEDKHSKSLKTEKSPMPKNSSKSKKSTIPINNHNNNSNNNSTNHRNAKQNGSVKEANQVSPPTTKAPAKPGKDTLEPTYLHELVDLQKKIMSLEDRNLLQRVVDLIEETGCYQVTSKSFDFDLCRLDQTTVRKLKQCLLL